MKITEVRIFPKGNGDKKLRAFVTVTFDDCFVVRDIKIIEGKKGLFVAMPSRKVKEPCTQCGHRNVLDARFCSHCGQKLDPKIASHATDSSEAKKQRQEEHKDIAHPITLDYREYLQKTILEAYHGEISKAQSPGAASHHEGQS